jgi:2-methylcitrate dehydratase PrpD
MEASTGQLADVYSGLNYEAIPLKVVERTRWLVLDNLGVILGATVLDFGKEMAEFGRALQMVFRKKT